MRYHFLSVLCILQLSLGCGSSANNVAARPESGKQYLALGDSYTIGESVEARSSW